MKQAEEHRLVTLAANRKLGAVQAELTDTSDKLALQIKQSEQLSSSASDMQKDLQSMTAARDEKEEALDQERSTCAELKRQLAEFASRHQNDLKAAGDEEAKLATQVGFHCCMSFYLHACTARLCPRFAFRLTAIKELDVA